MTPRARVASVEQDAAELYDAATAFIRLYQFRDRDQALRFELTVVQAYALDILLATGEQSLTALAQGLHLDKSTTSRVVAGMTRRGLIEWSRPGNDLRGKQIVASSEGKRRYERLRRAIVRDNARLLSSYSPAARRAIIAALRELTQRASGASATPSIRSRAPANR